MGVVDQIYGQLPFHLLELVLELEFLLDLILEMEHPKVKNFNRPAGSPKPRDEVSPTTEQPTSNATSPWPLTPQDSMDEEMESKSHTVCIFVCVCVFSLITNTGGFY